MSETMNLTPFLFNPFEPGFDANPYPMYERLREEAPVYHWTIANCYLVTRYEDVAGVIRDPRFSHRPQDAGLPPLEASMLPEFRVVLQNAPLWLQPKDHVRVRRAIGPAFSPRALEQLRPVVQGIINDALSSWDQNDENDVVPFAEHVPVSVIAAMLAIPPGHYETFRHFSEAWINVIDPRTTPTEMALLAKHVTAGMDLLRSLIAVRRNNLGDDILSVVIRAEQEGDTLSEDEMISLVAGIIIAGMDTTVHSILFAAYDVLRVPERLELARREPSMLQGILDESLRRNNFGKAGMWRWATEDLEVGGVLIPRGSLVCAHVPSALTDPRAFPDADRFDPSRQPRDKESIAFGHGPHYCIGAALAKLEAASAISTLLKRFPHLRLAGEPVFGNHLLFRQMTSLRVSTAPPRE